MFITIVALWLLCAISASVVAPTSFEIEESPDASLLSLWSRAILIVLATIVLTILVLTKST